MFSDRFQAESSKGTSEENKDSILNNLNKRAAAAKSKNIVNSCALFCFAFPHNTSCFVSILLETKKRQNVACEEEHNVERKRKKLTEVVKTRQETHVDSSESDSSDEEVSLIYREVIL